MLHPPGGGSIHWRIFVSLVQRRKTPEISSDESWSPAIPADDRGVPTGASVGTDDGGVSPRGLRVDDDFCCSSVSTRSIASPSGPTAPS